MKQVAKAVLGSDLSVFSQWLSSEGLQHRITELEGMQVILMPNERYKAQVERALEQYLSEPEFQTWVKNQLSENLIRLKTNAPSDSEFLLNYTRATPKQAPVIFFLIVVSAVFAFLSDFGQGGPLLRAMLILDPFKLSLDLSTMSGRWDGLIEFLAMGEVWRVLTPDFIHFNVMHITFNLLMLWVLGGQLEIQKGSISFIALVIFVSIISADAPVYSVLTETTGVSISGNSLKGSMENATMPKVKSNTLITMAKTGRFTLRSVIFT